MIKEDLKIAMQDEVTFRRCLILIYNNQTLDEQAVRFTTEENKVGFNKIDASFLSKLAQKVESGLELEEKEFKKGVEKLKKYAGQILAMRGIEEPQKKGEEERRESGR